MESSLNRSMHAMWSSHRAKVNLNSPLPTPQSPNGPASKTSLSNPASEKPATLDPRSKSPEPNASTATTGAPKRKSRGSAANSSNKRVKFAAASTETGLQKYPPPPHTLSSLGGLQSTISTLIELAALPLLHPEIYVQTGVSPPRGVLLTGPPGCGKTAIAGGLAGTLQLPFISVSAPSVVSGMSGESESKLRDVFEEAKACAPSILFLDELDAIAPKRESAQREMEKRIVAQLLTCLDDLHWHKPPPDSTDDFIPKPVIVLAATNRPDSLDSALRRAGRFDNEVVLGVPDTGARESILRTLTAPLCLSPDVDLRDIAGRTPGYVGADLAALVGKAGSRGVKRIWKSWDSSDLISQALTSTPILETQESEMKDNQPQDSATNYETDKDVVSGPTTDEAMVVDAPSNLELGALPATAPGLDLLPPASSDGFDLPFLNPTTQALLTNRSPLPESLLRDVTIDMEDFLLAIPEVQPSSTREGFTSVPSVKWEAVGGVKGVREDLTLSIIAPIRHPALFASVGISGGGGVLLWGPPGCGKTLLARATAGECRANFVCVRGPEVVNKYVGESERALRQIFSRARASSPCVIFFDEIDALVPRRDDQLSESSARIVNTFLTELDSLDPSSSSQDEKRSVYVIGATNRPDMIDPAMVRPGRLDKLLYVDLPNQDERVEIVKAVVRSRDVPLASEDKDEKKDTWAKVEALVRGRCEGFSGADLASLVREAGVVALRRVLATLPTLSSETTELETQAEPDKVSLTITDFEDALARVSPSVSASQRRKYEMLRSKFAGLPVRSGRKGEDEDKKVEE